MNAVIEKTKPENIIVIFGLLAEKCLYKTAPGGMKKGFEVFEVPDAIVGKTPESKEKAIRKMIGKGVQILLLE
ncbi:MAG: isochorismatase family protein [Bacteroidetes bacterium]|nr:isochorismatase family protein [Bacteroidota bacterium]